MSRFSDFSGCDQMSGFPRQEPRIHTAEEDACFFAQRNNQPDTGMNYIVTVHEIKIDPQSGVASTAQEIFKQAFPEIDLSKFAVALNQKPRGRKPRPAKEGTK